LHQYPREIKTNDFGPVRESILLEINCFGSPTPYEPMQIRSFIADFLKRGESRNAIIEYGLEPFNVPVQVYTRTFVEKILSLSYASFMDAGAWDIEVRERVRHFYDLTILSGVPEIRDFLHSDRFVAMMKRVRDEERLSSRVKWVDRTLATAPLHDDPDAVLNSVETYFGVDLEPMVYQSEDLPDFAKVRDAFEAISQRIRLSNL
jgi:hypothetical protein